jgi:antitoxin component YwqK of YwqJK toxin-antitoxin module
MKYVLLLLTLILSTAQANLEATYRNNLLINPNTNQPYTGNLETINNNWGKDAVEYSQEYVNGLRHGSEKAFYKTGQLKSEGNFNQGTIEGVVSLYFEDGGVFEEVRYAFGTPKYMRVYRENGTLADEKGFFDNKIIKGVIE